MVRITTVRNGRRQEHVVGGNIAAVTAAIAHTEDGQLRFGKKWWHVLVSVDEIVSLEPLPPTPLPAPSKDELLRAARDRDRQRADNEERELAHREACVGGTEVVVRSRIDGERTSYAFALPLREVVDQLVSAPQGFIQLSDGLRHPVTVRVDSVESVRPIPR